MDVHVDIYIRGHSELVGVLVEALIAARHLSNNRDSAREIARNVGVPAERERFTLTVKRIRQIQEPPAGREFGPGRILRARWCGNAKKYERTKERAYTARQCHPKILRGARVSVTNVE